MSIESNGKELTKKYLERTYKIIINSEYKQPVRVKVSREVIEDEDGSAKKYRAVGIKDCPAFKPEFEFGSGDLIGHGDFEYIDKDGRKRLFHSQNLYHVISAFCDSMSKK